MKNDPSEAVRRLTEPGSSILAAVSGGSDSAALLHILAGLAPELSLTLRAVHFNHQLRGAESDGDEAFTRELAASLGVECICEDLCVTEYASLHGMATEEAARCLRYERLSALKDTLRADYIATAHTLNDRTETILLNILRGSGLAGLCPLPEKRGCYLRPLVGFTKAELQEYLKERRISYRTDSTNLQDIYRRNRLRNTVIPLLKEHFNPNLDASLSNLAEIAGNANEYIMDAVRAFLSGQGEAPSVEALLEQPVIIRHSAIRELIAAAKGEYRDITLKEVKRIDALLAGGPFDTELIGGGLYAVSDGRYLRITDKARPEFRRDKYTLQPDSELTVNGQRL
ncbi:MAG: tRNA lysidine(34) synthetase TilS, partial [Abditibacteriota bacterium]|nr:tRNA lysidine(34) synthetase TilS [Abditibacteriota bacterium]